MQAEEYAGSFTRSVGDYRVSPVHRAAARIVGAGPGMRTLDVGCGEGELVGLLAATGAEASGVDFLPRAVEVARVRVPTGKFEVAPATALPFTGETFGAVTALGVIGYLGEADRLTFLAEVRRVLVPGGKLVLRVSPPTNAVGQKVLSLFRRGEPSRAKRFSRKELAALLSGAGFTVRDSWLSLDRGGLGITTLPLLALFPFFAQRWVVATS